MKKLKKAKTVLAVFALSGLFAVAGVAWGAPSVSAACVTQNGIKSCL